MERPKTSRLALGALYLCIIGVSLSLYARLQYGSLEDLFFIIKPVVFIVEKATGIKFYYNQSLGFVNQQGNVVINQACAGIRFWMAALSMLGFSFVSKIRGLKKQWMMVLAFILFSYIITVFANASRIIGAIWVLDFSIGKGPSAERLLHQSIGVLFYWTYLLITYGIFSRLFRKEGDYEKII